MKERIKDTIGTFFIIVTLIDIAMFVMGMILGPDQRFGYEVFIYPVIYGALASIPGLVINSKKEMTVAQAIVREIVQLFVIIALILVFMFAGKDISRELIVTGAFVAMSIVIVFVLVNIIRWWLDSKTADQMTKDLQKWKKRTV